MKDKLTIKQTKKQNYMSLDKIAYGYKINPRWAAEHWLSEPTTLEYIQLWEATHNTNFKNEKFLELCSVSLAHKTFPTVIELINKAKIKCIFVDSNFDRSIYLHRDIAIDFASWLSPAFRAFCLLNIQSKSKDLISFVSEEDLIISDQTIAKATKQSALKAYIKEVFRKKQDKINSNYDYCFKKCNNSN